MHTCQPGEEWTSGQFRRSIIMAITITTAATGSTILGSHGIERNQGVIWLQNMSLASFRLSWIPSRTGVLMLYETHMNSFQVPTQRAIPSRARGASPTSKIRAMSTEGHFER